MFQVGDFIYGNKDNHYGVTNSDMTKAIVTSCGRYDFSLIIIEHSELGEVGCAYHRLVYKYFSKLPDLELSKKDVSIKNKVSELYKYKFDISNNFHKSLLFAFTEPLLRDIVCNCATVSSAIKNIKAEYKEMKIYLEE